MEYPKARRDETVDNYFGVDVPDPYRWMETTDTPELKEWIEGQNKLTEGYLAKLPGKDKIKDAFSKMYNYEKVGAPSRRGDRYFFLKNNGLQNQHVLFTTKDLKGEAEVLLDPNTLSEDGTAALGTTAISEDARYLAYTVHQSGSDWATLYFRDIETKKDLDESIQWLKFSSVAWTLDGKGLFYSRYPKNENIKDMGTETDKNENHKVYYHKLGTNSSEDVVVYEEPEHPKWLFGAEVTDDGEYLIITPSESTAPVNRLFLAKVEEILKSGPSAVTKVIDNFEAEYSYITNDGPVFYFKNNLNAPRYRVVSMDISSPSPAVTEVIPQSDSVLEYVVPTNHRFMVLSYLENVHSVLKLYTLAGEYVKDIPMGNICSLVSLNSRKTDDEFFYKYSAFTEPGTNIHFKFSSPESAEGTSTVLYQTKVSGMDPSVLESKQVWYSSKDGTKVPMFLVHKKGMPVDGVRPVYLYGYGGFSISISPYFSVFSLFAPLFLDGILAIPNIRGGGEFGEEWHEAGTLLRKQNVFDDFIAAAEFLVAEGYTTPAKIAISGGSNGGLLVGAVVNQRPELFGCAIPAVGVMDMLRFHKFTIGYAWVADYGSSEKEEEFHALVKYSPVHTVKVNPKSQFPAIFAKTSDHDDRVVPLHTFKYIAELQHTICPHPSQKNPILARIETKAGHGAGKPTTKIIEEYVDTYAFMCLALNETPKL